MNDGEDVQDDCPLNPQYGHKYFIFQVRDAYELTNQVDMDENFAGNLYRKMEYAVLGCNCGSIMKKAVTV